MAEESGEEKRLRAKPVSLIGQIAAGIWIAGFGSFHVIRNIERIGAWDIVLLGFGIAGAFAPVYANMIFDKKRGTNE